MIIKPSVSVISSDRVEKGLELTLQAPQVPGAPDYMSIPDAYAYSPLINSHDHLIGNWLPHAGDNRPYINSHIWVEDMKNAFSYHERNIFWINDGSFDLLNPSALILAKLGSYKNLFSGCGIVQDHAPVQKDEYYQSFPIKVPKEFRQCHSITLQNWWGGESPAKELALSKGVIPFVIHLGEGIGDITKHEFAELVAQNLLQANTLLIHGIAFTESDIRQIAAKGASVCWCPTSNMFLIGETFKVEYALEQGVNVTIGTDSTMSGGINIIAEFLMAKQICPNISTATLYKMATENAAKALMLPAKYGKLDPDATSNLLLIDKIDSDPFENLLHIEPENIRLLMVDGVPRFGDAEWIENWLERTEDYTLFRTGKREKFVLGDPMELNDIIDEKLGYHKDFAYLPF